MKIDNKTISFIIDEETNIIDDDTFNALKKENAYAKSRMREKIFKDRLHTVSIFLIAIGSFGILVTSKEFGNDFNHSFWILFTGISLYILVRMSKL